MKSLAVVSIWCAVVVLGAPISDADDLRIIQEVTIESFANMKSAHVIEIKEALKEITDSFVSSQQRAKALSEMINVNKANCAWKVFYNVQGTLNVEPLEGLASATLKVTLDEITSNIVTFMYWPPIYRYGDVHYNL